MKEMSHLICMVSPSVLWQLFSEFCPATTLLQLYSQLCNTWKTFHLEKKYVCIKDKFGGKENSQKAFSFLNWFWLGLSMTHYVFYINWWHRQR